MVGKHEQARTALRDSLGCCGETIPPRIEPELGKVVKDVGEANVNVIGHVLEEDQRRSALVDDSPHVRPEVPFVVFAESLAGA